VREAVNKAFSVARKRGWEYTYWAVDIHETVLVPTYSRVPSVEFYPFAAEVLKDLTERPDVVLIMYTSSKAEDIAWYRDLCASRGIRFDHVNANLAVPSNDYADFSQKFYFNVLLDDKAGFDPYGDWLQVADALAKQPLLVGPAPTTPT
jgi:hypothetical protein